MSKLLVLRFSSPSKKNPAKFFDYPYPHPLPLFGKPCSLSITVKIKLDEISTKINEKCKPVLHCFSSFEMVLLLKVKAMQLPGLLLLVFYISFCISRCHFIQLRTSFNILWNFVKKDFSHKFSFLMDSSPPPHPFNGQNPLIDKFFVNYPITQLADGFYPRVRIHLIRNVEFNTKKWLSVYWCPGIYPSSFTNDCFWT